MATQLQTAITIINAGIEQEFAELRRSHPDQEAQIKSRIFALTESLQALQLYRDLKAA
jgi:hypothetical protein